MHNRLKRELRVLRVHALVTTPLLLILALGAFYRAQQQTRFTEIDVERINIIEPDGKLRMVISNRPRSTGPIYKGEPFGYPGGSRPGIIFFNDEETENGGLTFHGSRQPDGSFRAGGILTFDQFDQDQIVVLRYTDDTGRRQAGLTFLDRTDGNIFDLVAERDSIMQMPDGPERAAALERWRAPRNGVPLVAQRVYVGRNVDRAATLTLSDPTGRPRLRLMVDSLGAASVEFLDETGAVTARLPQALTK